MYLAEDHFRKTGVREKTKIHYYQELRGSSRSRSSPRR